jgi:hypothetical protein
MIMAREASENAVVHHALDRLAAWMGPGTTNEAIELQVGRVSCNWIGDDVSFITGGGDATFIPSGARGTITQTGAAYGTDPAGTTVVPYSITVDLNHANVTMSFTLPAHPPRTVHFSLEAHKNRFRVDAQSILFTDDGSTDDAGYALSFILL